MTINDNKYKDKFSVDMGDSVYMPNSNYSERSNIWEELSQLTGLGTVNYKELKDNVEKQYMEIVKKYQENNSENTTGQYIYINEHGDDIHAIFYTGLDSMNAQGKKEPIFAVLSKNKNYTANNHMQYWLGYRWAYSTNFLVKEALENKLLTVSFISQDNVRELSDKEKEQIQAEKDKFVKELPYEFKYFSTLFDNDMKLLKSIASSENENWGMNNVILKNYFMNVYQKLAYDYNNASPESKDNFFVFSEDRDYVCFNIGLFDEYQRQIYCVLWINERAGKIKDSQNDIYYQHYKISNFCDEENLFLHNTFLDKKLPERPYFFNNPAELVYDYRKNIIPNTIHILNEHSERLPEEIQRLAPSDQKAELDKAISQSKRRLQENYKLAVPQYYPAEHRIQLLLPLKVGTAAEKENLALVIRYDERLDEYQGVTCLPISFAYGNARLIVKPENEWLKISDETDVSIDQMNENIDEN